MSKIFPTSVYAELTPNPKTMKFVADRDLIDNGLAVEYFSAGETKDSSELAGMLFNFPFVSGVFISSNFITVTNNGQISWDLVNYELREFIREYLLKNELVVTKLPVSKKTAIKNEVIDNSPVAASEFDEQIKDLLEEFVRPAVEGDGGAIDFKSFQHGIVTVSLRGSCSGCPSSLVTLKDGIENLLKSYIVEVREVVAEEL